MPLIQIEDRDSLKSMITESQHCQRSWDLTQTIPAEDIDVLKTAVQQAPSKQNRTFFKAVFITNQDVIKKIHRTTGSFTTSWEPRITTTNPQVLANCLVVFLRDRDPTQAARVEDEFYMGVVSGRDVSGRGQAFVDEHRTVGLAAGYLLYTAHLLGYRTGCYDGLHNVDVLYDMFGNNVLLMVGIGYNDPARNSREHQQDPTFTFPSFGKTIIIEDESVYANTIINMTLPEEVLNEPINAAALDL